MTRTACLAAAALLLIGAAPAEAPAVDHVATYDRPPPMFGRPAEQTLLQHRDRIRIDSRVTLKDIGVVLVRHEYQAPGQAVAFTVSRFEDGRLATLSLMDDPETSPPTLSSRTFTRETETWLGRTCRVWSTSHPTAYGFTFVQSGCRSADGVELWRRMATIDYVVARQVTLRPVTAAEVRPPLETLDLMTWVAADRRGGGKAGHAGDYEVVMGSDWPGGRQRIARRSGAWTSITDVTPGRSTDIQVSNRAEHVRLHYSRDPGHRSLDIDAIRDRRRPFDGLEPVRLSSEPDERILGERCSWWHMTPGVQDYSRAECMTGDGVTLKVREEGRGSGELLVATRLTRRPQPLAAVMPDPKLVGPGAWGF